jgi:hypothetical protein
LLSKVVAPRFVDHGRTKIDILEAMKKLLDIGIKIIAAVATHGHSTITVIRRHLKV